MLTIYVKRKKLEPILRQVKDSYKQNKKAVLVKDSFHILPSDPNNPPIPIAIGTGSDISSGV